MGVALTWFKTCGSLSTLAMGMMAQLHSQGQIYPMTKQMIIVMSFQGADQRPRSRSQGGHSGQWLDSYHPAGASLL
jgi:hypothetical protein